MGCDRAEFEALVREHRATLARWARRLAGNAEDAEDLLQQSLLDAYRGFHGFRAGTSFPAWMGRILRNNQIDRARRKQRPASPLRGEAGENCAHEPADPASDPQALLLRDRLDEPFEQALAALRPHHRATVLLCDLGGATYEEAARAEECPVGTIRSRLSRAHARLQELLQDVQQRMAPPVPQAAASLHTRRGLLRFTTAAAAGAAMGGLTRAEAAEQRVAVLGEGAAEVAAALSEAAREAEAPLRIHAGSPRHADVIVFTGGTLTKGAAEEISRAVLREGRGFVALHAGECAGLAALFPSPPTVRATERCEGAMLRVNAPRHPIVAGMRDFAVRELDAACCDFAGAPPDVALLSRESGGRAHWQALAWRAGAGRAVYFPARATAALLREPEIRRVLVNALRWAAGAG